MKRALLLFLLVTPAAAEWKYTEPGDWQYWCPPAYAPGAPRATREPTVKECKGIITKTKAHVKEREKIRGANIGMSSVGCATYCSERYGLQFEFDE